MYVINHRGLFFTITGILLVGAIVAIFAYGLPLSIDFTGGSLIQVTYTHPRPDVATLQKALAPEEKTDRRILSSSKRYERCYAPHALLLLLRNTHKYSRHFLINNADPLTEDQYTTVGPSLGSQLESNSLWALLAVIAAIVVYIAFAFRKVSRPVPSWGYGLTVVAMLAIDIIVPTGFYAIYCHFTGAQVDSLFVIALLALLGYLRQRRHRHLRPRTRALE